MEKLIDIHIHVGHKSEWSQAAKTAWMDTGPRAKELYDDEGRQMAGP